MKYTLLYICIFFKNKLAFIKEIKSNEAVSILWTVSSIG